MINYKYLGWDGWGGVECVRIVIVVLQQKSCQPFKIYQKEGYMDVRILMQRAQNTAGNIQGDRISPAERQIYKPIAYAFKHELF